MLLETVLVYLVLESILGAEKTVDPFSGLTKETSWSKCPNGHLELHVDKFLSVVLGIPL